ncbi:MAG: glycosyltransferase family 4 protein [Patescibacteria group bacterium]|nr:glycosyltransferase family 4 protein [Patescibacteria group bacterium]
MEKLGDKTLALFFTRGVSLQTWKDIGGIDREILLYKHLAKHFRSIFFFTYGDGNDLKYQNMLPQNITIVPQKYRMPSSIYSFLLPFLFPKELGKADIIKTNQMHGSWAAVIAKHLYHTKLVVRCGYEWLDVIEKRELAKWKLKLAYLLEALSYKNANRIVLTSQGDKEFVEDRFNIESSKIQIIPNYIDSDRFKPDGRKKEKNRIIFVGKLEEQKNVFSLIEAVSTLPVKLIIVGNGSQRKELEDFAVKKGANVEFKGNIPQEILAKELNKSEIFILPSLYEGHPKALLEGMSCELPCIGTDVGGINNVITHKQNGYLCKPNPQDIGKAIKDVLNDKQLQVIMGRNARKEILENFSVETILEKELQLYQELL